MVSIVSVRADRVRVPFRRPFATSAGMWLEREAWILQLTDADGRVGHGEAVLEPSDGATAASVLEHLVRELVSGSGQRSGAGSGSGSGSRSGSSAPIVRLPTAAELEMHGSPGRALRAAIDSARLDLGDEAIPGLDGADTAAEPWGIGVNATLPSIDPRASAEAALQAVEAGFRTLKLKAGAERETEVLVDRVGAVRRAVGPDVRLRLDVNGAWDLETATERLDAVARFALEYVEQPLTGDDAAALAELRRRVRVPIAADESVVSLRAARELLDAGAVDALVVKPARVGGPVAVAEIADLAAGRGVPVVVSTLFETGVGIAAGLAIAAALPAVAGGGPGPSPTPRDHGLATSGLLEHDLLVDGLVLEDGRLRAPGGAETGRLGIRVSERALAQYGTERPPVDVWGL